MGEILYVLGMHRSGTSALSRVLSLCGARLPEDLLPPARDNPTGFWEPRKAVELNDAFLASQNSELYDPSSILQVAPVSERATRRFVAEISSFIKGLDIQSLTVVKDPRICMLLPYWLAGTADAGHSASAIQIFRNPYEVARSLSHRQQMTPAHALALWVSHNLFAERDSRTVQRIFLTYDSLLSDWRAQISRCINELGLPLATSPKAEATVKEFLSSDLRHHRVGDFESAGCQVAETNAKGVYELLNAAVHEGADRPAFDEQVRLMTKSGPFLAEEATRESWRLEVDLRLALAGAEGVLAQLEHRLHALEGAN